VALARSPELYGYDERNDEEVLNQKPEERLQRNIEAVYCRHKKQLKASWFLQV
jgi:hypothetical protein